MEVFEKIGDGLWNAFQMAWEVGWALVLGFLLSGIVQAWIPRERIEAGLNDPDSAYQRLRRVMDAWAALWFWPVTAPVAAPSREEWISALEALLGVADAGGARQGRGMHGSEVTWAGFKKSVSGVYIG